MRTVLGKSGSGSVGLDGPRRNSGPLNSGRKATGHDPVATRHGVFRVRRDPDRRLQPPVTPTTATAREIEDQYRIVLCLFPAPRGGFRRGQGRERILNFESPSCGRNSQSVREALFCYVCGAKGTIGLNATPFPITAAL